MSTIAIQKFSCLCRQTVFEIYWYNYTKIEIEVFWHLLVHKPYTLLHNFSDKKKSLITTR